MIDLSTVKITSRDHEVLELLVQGLSNIDIGKGLGISPRTVKQHIQRLSHKTRCSSDKGNLRASLALAYLRLTDPNPDHRELTAESKLSPRCIQVAQLVYRGFTNKQIGEGLGNSEQVIKNYMRVIMDTLGCWSRLELVIYVYFHGGDQWPCSEPAKSTQSSAVPLPIVHNSLDKHPRLSV